MLPLEESIIVQLQKDGPCCLEEMVTHLSSFGWGAVFSAVDRMSRDGRVVLHQRGYSTYQLSLGSQFAVSSSTSSQTGQTTRNVVPIAHVPAQ
jgi:hypothetical protein